MAVTQEKKQSVEAAPEKKSIDVEPPGTWYGARHTQIIMLFLLITIGYGMRVNLSVGIVAMTDPTVNPDFPTYDWDDKSIILSSFYWGYVIPQIGAGQLAKAYGPRWFLAGSMFISSLFSILIPFMAELGSWGVIICRVMQGLAQGFIFPCCHNMLAKWVPPNERARLATFAYAGGPFGTVLSLPITGWISESSLGWPTAFYSYGAAGLLWTAAWMFVGKNSPAEHNGIDPQEKKYIEASLGQIENKAAPATPWKAIFTSLPVWAILIAHSGQNWGFSTLLTNIPTYMSGVLNFDIKSGYGIVAGYVQPSERQTIPPALITIRVGGVVWNYISGGDADHGKVPGVMNGLLSAGPYFVFWMLSFIFSGITDYVIVNGIVSVVVARKIANSIGLYVPAAALLALALISNLEDIANITLALLFIAVGINSCSICGFNVNHIDLSPNHAGTLMGITNGCSNIFSIIAPLAIQYIVSDETDPSQWAMVFYIATGVYIVGNTFFVLFASGEIQPWNSIEPEATIVVPEITAAAEKEGKEPASTRY